MEAVSIYPTTRRHVTEGGNFLIPCCEMLIVDIIYFFFSVVGLHPGKKHQVRVLAATSKGWPIQADDFEWQDLEMPSYGSQNVPQAPTVHLTVVNSTSIEVLCDLSEKELLYVRCRKRRHYFSTVPITLKFWRSSLERTTSLSIWATIFISNFGLSYAVAWIPPDPSLVVFHWNWIWHQKW